MRIQSSIRGACHRKLYLVLGALDVGSMQGQETASYCKVCVLGSFRALSDANKAVQKRCAQLTMARYTKEAKYVPYLEHKEVKGRLDVRQKLFQNGNLVRTTRFWVQEFASSSLDNTTRQHQAYVVVKGRLVSGESWEARVSSGSVDEEAVGVFLSEVEAKRCARTCCLDPCELANIDQAEVEREIEAEMEREKALQPALKKAKHLPLAEHRSAGAPTPSDADQASSRAPELAQDEGFDCVEDEEGAGEEQEPDSGSLMMLLDDMDEEERRSGGDEEGDEEEERERRMERRRPAETEEEYDEVGLDDDDDDEEEEEKEEEDMGEAWLSWITVCDLR